jgi:hypothetical protein
VISPLWTELSVPRLRQDLHKIRLDGELVVWQPSGDLHRFDPIATAVVDLLDGERTVTEIATLLAQATGASPTEIEQDVLALLDELSQLSLLIRPGQAC